MKLKFLFGLLFILAFSVLTFAQNVIITPKKVVYTRKKMKGFENKRTFDITYPLVSGPISVKAKNQLEKTISYWSIFETSLPENMDEYWLTAMLYKVEYNKNGILDIALTQEGVGSPDQQTIELVVDLKTGNPVKLSDAFKTDSLPDFAQMINAKLEVEKKQIIQKIDHGDFSGDGTAPNDSLKEDVCDLSFATDNFNEYSVSDSGITIFYDAGFAHALKAAQPDGHYFFKWSEIKPFIKSDGIAARFLK